MKFSKVKSAKLLGYEGPIYTYNIDKLNSVYIDTHVGVEQYKSIARNWSLDVEVISPIYTRDKYAWRCGMNIILDNEDIFKKEVLLLFPNIAPRGRQRSCALFKTGQVGKKDLNIIVRHVAKELNEGYFNYGL
jgi:hypothetical protein